MCGVNGSLNNDIGCVCVNDPSCVLVSMVSGYIGNYCLRNYYIKIISKVWVLQVIFIFLHKPHTFINGFVDDWLSPLCY